MVLKNKILICGIGNLLMHDDGFAHYVLKTLEEKLDKLKNKGNLPDDIAVEIIDLGTVNFTMANLLDGYKFAIFIDTIHQNNEPGEIYEFKIKSDKVRNDIDPFKFAFGFHDSDLLDMLVFAKKMKFLPEKIIIIGCEPKTIKAGIGLSEEVLKASEKVVNRVLEICMEVYSPKQMAEI